MMSPIDSGQPAGLNRLLSSAAMLVQQDQLDADSRNLHFFSAIRCRLLSAVTVLALGSGTGQREGRRAL
jgi:hypothetical protein